MDLRKDIAKFIELDIESDLALQRKFNALLETRYVLVEKYPKNQNYRKVSTSIEDWISSPVEECNNYGVKE